jgi:hypothetical protein
MLSAQMCSILSALGRYDNRGRCDGDDVMQGHFRASKETVQMIRAWLCLDNSRLLQMYPHSLSFDTKILPTVRCITSMSIR